MDGSTPQVFEVDPAGFRVPAELSASVPGEGEIVILLSEAESRSEGWSGRAAVALAQAWAEEGRRVLLADGDLRDASLDRWVDGSHGEGLVDSIVYGASLDRVATAREDDGFRFIPAGTPIAEGDAAYSNPRCLSLLAEIRDSGALLLLFLPAEAEGVEGLVASGDRVLRFADRAPAGGWDGPEFAIFHPQGRVGGGEAPTHVSDAEAPARKSERRKERAPGSVGRWAAWALLLLLVLIGGALAAAWLGYITLPGVPVPTTAAGLGLFLPLQSILTLRTRSMSRE